MPPKLPAITTVEVRLFASSGTAPARHSNAARTTLEDRTTSYRQPTTQPLHPPDALVERFDGSPTIVHRQRRSGEMCKTHSQISKMHKGTFRMSLRDYETRSAPCRGGIESAAALGDPQCVGDRAVQLQTRSKVLMTRYLVPTRGYRALLALDALAFAVFYLLPQFTAVESNAARSALELDGYGALIAMSHPLSIALTTAVRLTFVGLLFFGLPLGRYVLLLSVFLSCVSAVIGGLTVLTAVDLLAMTILYLLDGCLLTRTFPSGKATSGERAS